MPRYTDRYDALEAGKPFIQERKSRRSAPVKKTNFFALLSIAVLSALVVILCVAVVVAPKQELARAQQQLRARVGANFRPVDLSKVQIGAAAPEEGRFYPKRIHPIDVSTAAARAAAQPGRVESGPNHFGDNFWKVEQKYVEDAGRQREQLAWVPLRKVVASPKLFPVQGPSAKDFSQSTHVGNCWLMASVSALANALPEYLTRFSSGPEVSEKGLYTVNLFDPIAQDWTPVTVDDTLPVDYAHTKRIAELDQIPGGNLFGASPSATDAFWMMIVEKAIAQLKSRSGDYYAMSEGGSSELAWTMLTGQQTSEAWNVEKKNAAYLQMSDVEANFGRVTGRA